ncbi:MAG: hypothetical protein QOH06_1704 [Acidobacteriota bacterium]|jgi:chromosome segregation ATPase|nr:hypothetical protein [Acidobacteriota bacterium]
MDPELIAYLDERFRGIDERFRETSQQIQELREETSKRFNKMDEQLRLTDVRVEGLQSQIQVVAEGVAAGNEKLDSFKTDVAKEFSDTRSLIKDGYKELDKRVRVLERRAGVS